MTQTKFSTHVIRGASNKNENPDLLGEHIYYLITEGQWFLSTIRDGRVTEAASCIMDQYIDLRESDLLPINPYDKDLFYTTLKTARSIQSLTFEGDLDDAIKLFGFYFNDFYVKYFLHMDLQSFFTYSMLIQTTEMMTEERLKIVDAGSMDEDDEDWAVEDLMDREDDLIEREKERFLFEALGTASAFPNDEED